MNRPSTRSSRVRWSLVSAVLLAAAAGCDRRRRRPAAAGTPSATATARHRADATPVATSVTLAVEVTQLRAGSATGPAAGRRPGSARRRRVVRRGVPRRRLPALGLRRLRSAGFTPGAAAGARARPGAADQPPDSAPRSTPSRPPGARRTSRVLAPHGQAAGVTAAVDLDFVVDRGDRPAQRVQLRRPAAADPATDDGAWRIFGYDVATRRSRHEPPRERRSVARRPGASWCWRWCSPLPRWCRRPSVQPTDIGAGQGCSSAQAVDPPAHVVWILAVGSDARPGEDMTRTRGDALQLVGIEPRDRAPPRSIGVPRDSWVDIPGTAATRSTPRSTTAARS